MSRVGYASLVVIPSVRGISGAIASQVTAPLNVAAVDAGRSFGSRIASGVATGAKVAVGTITAIGGTVAGIAAKGGISRALNIQDARASLVGLKMDTAAVDGVMSSALASVQGTAFGLDQAAKTAAGAVAAGIAPGEALTRTLKLTADAATIANTPIGEMGSIFNKVATAGYLTRDVVNQLQDRGIPVLQLVAQQYGVTAQEASDMVSEGKVDFATFQNAIEAGMGGAALASGKTARGAFANVGAALSRLGAMFAQPAIDAAPALFTSVAGAVDRAATALKPFAADLATRLGPAFQAAGAYIDSIDFQRIIDNVVDIKDLLSTGFTENETALPPAFADGLQQAHNVAVGLYNLIVKGDFTPALQRAFNIEEDSPFVTFVLGARDAVSGFVSSLTQGDLSGVASSIGSSMSTLQPALAAFGAELPKIGQASATLVSGGITVLTQVLSFLADNVDTIVQFMPLIVAGFIAWRVASGAVASATLSLRAGELLATPVYFANNVMRNNSVRIERELFAAKAASTAATSTNTGATNVNTAATARGRIATIAASTAARVAAAGQWLLNAALSANPIAIIILAITALVAGLVWFFTQTEIGRTIWEGAMAAIGTAATWLWESVISPVFNFIGGIFQWLWTTIISPIVGLVVNYFRFWGAVAMWLWNNAIAPALGFVGQIFQWLWASVISPVIGWIVGAVNVFGAIISALWAIYVQPAINLIGGIFQWLWQTIVVPVFNGLRDTISAAWLWIDAYVFAPFRAGLDLLGQGFERTGRFIADVWNGIKAAAAAPINFVLDTVWNNGLRSFWNDLVTELGLSDMKLPAANLIKFADGSENHVAQIAGPGAMRLWAEPETGGEAYIPLAASKRGRSTSILANVANRFGYSITPYADGGFWGGVSSIAGDVWDNITGAAAKVGEFLTDPAAAIERNVIQGIIEPLLGDASPWLRVAGQLPINLIRAMVEPFKKAAPRATGTTGMGWEAMWAMVQGLLPGAVMTSNYRPGSVTVNGGQSYHALGRAIDVIPATMATFNRLLALFPNARELIYSPAGDRQLLNGQPHYWTGAVRNQHFDHVHVAMANGGILPALAAGANIRPRAGGTMAILGEGGRAETVTDLGLTNRMMAATLALVSDASAAHDESVNFHGDVTVADPDELVAKLKRSRRRAKAKAGVDGKVRIP